MLVIVPLAVGLLLLSRHYFEGTIRVRQRAADLENQILLTTLRHQMVEKDRDLIFEILQEIGSRDEINQVMILGHDGVISFSSQKEMVGETIPRDSPTCVVCHEASPEDRDRWIVLDGNLRSVLPIENSPECHECHDPKEKLNGMLILDVSLTRLEAEVAANTRWIAAGTVVVAALLLGGLGLVLRRLILQRLSKLGASAHAIKAGDLGSRIVVGGNDMISVLGNDINEMAESVSGLVREVKEQEARLANVMNSLDEGLLVLDSHYRVVASNLSFSRRIGSHPEAIRGRVCRGEVDSPLPCCSSDQPCPAATCISTGEVQRAIYQTPLESGEVGLVEEVHASPVFDDDCNVVQVVEVWRNITKRAHEEERLAEMDTLVSLGSLAAGFSHEVNTPLASMLTSADAILRRIREGRGPEKKVETLLPAIQKSAKIIRQQVLRCRKITEQFLRFSRGVPPTIEPLDLSAVVSVVVSLMAPTARESNVEIRVEEERRLPGVKANTEVVQHVLLNLFLNAVQSFDGKGGVVIVRLLVEPSVCIQVEDNGSGIPPEARSRLFGPFRSQKPQGTGLGLFLSRSFMRRFGGDVRLIRSEVGVGSTFEIVFAKTRVVK